MTKRRQPQQSKQPPSQHYPPPPAARGFDSLPILTLVGIVAVLMISFSNMRDISRIQDGLDGRLGKIETQIAQVSTKVDNIPSQPAGQQRRGAPDPNRAYQIKTEGAPAKGPANAAITIAEFSDFQ
jgi:hypothetical protein